MTNPDSSDEPPFLAGTDDPWGTRSSVDLPHPGARIVAGVLGAALAPTAVAFGLPHGALRMLGVVAICALVAVASGHLISRVRVLAAETSAALGFAGGLLATALGIWLVALLGPATLTPAEAAQLLVVPVGALVGPLAAAAAGTDWSEPPLARRLRQSVTFVLIGGALLAVVSPLLGNAQAAATHRENLADAITGMGVVVPVLPEIDGFEAYWVGLEHANDEEYVTIRFEATEPGEQAAISVYLHPFASSCSTLVGSEGRCDDSGEPGVQVAQGADAKVIAVRTFDSGLSVVLTGELPEDDAVTALAEAEKVDVSEIVAICDVDLGSAGPRCSPE